MGRLFGTDGVRGVANSELTPELAFSLGKAGAYVLSKESEKKPTFLIGMDTRISGDMLENALSAGILAVGGDVIKVGVLPTPAIAHLVKHYDDLIILMNITELNSSTAKGLNWMTASKRK